MSEKLFCPVEVTGLDPAVKFEMKKAMVSDNYVCTTE